jgi:hypothetical protein
MKPEYSGSSFARLPTHRDEAAMNGAPGTRLRSMPTLATMKPSLRWGTRICGATKDNYGDSGLRPE